MADYSVLDNNSQLVLESTLVSWQESQPQFNIAIRPKGQAGSTSWPKAQVFLPVYLMPDLLANLTDPNSAGIVQTNDRLNGAGTIGRFNSDFTITNNSGTGRVTLNEMQWKNTIAYFNQMYIESSVIKANGRCVRMHMINLLRELGLDDPDKNGGKFKTTQWYDYRFDSPKNFPRNAVDNNSGYAQNGYARPASQPNSGDDASFRNTPTGYPQAGRQGFGNANINSQQPSYPAKPNPVQQMGMASGTAMPPMPLGNTQQGGINNPVPGVNTIPGSSIPMGRPMPPLPGSGVAQSPDGKTMEMAGSIQDMLNDAFSQNLGGM